MLSNSHQPVLKTLGKRLMENASTPGTPLINHNRKVEKRQPDIVFSRCGTIMSRSTTFEVPLSTNRNYLKEKKPFNDSTRVKKEPSSGHIKFYRTNNYSFHKIII